MRILNLYYALLLLLCSGSASAQILVPGADGSDGIFAPTEDVVIDLGLAPNALWNSPGSGVGVYDAQRWAVVFKYTSIDVPEGVTVTFKNHPSRAPVVWLVSGSVDISGTVSLNGQPGSQTPGSMAEPGPGGFRGGPGFQNSTAPFSSGYGPGGGIGARAWASHENQGSAAAGLPYGNPRLLPLLGGSGGAGWEGGARNGGAGGGALLIASSTSVTVDGLISSKLSGSPFGTGGRGSAGSIRVISDLINGAGRIVAAGEGGFSDGRVRLEANTADGGLATFPPVNIIPPDSPVLIWPPDGAPEVTIISIGSQNAPLDPRASVDISSTDISLSSVEAQVVTLQTRNVPSNAVVTLRVTQKVGEGQELLATYEAGTTALSTWVVNEELPTGFFVLQARADLPTE